MAVKFMVTRTTYIGNGALADAKDDICKLGEKPLLLQDSQWLSRDIWLRLLICFRIMGLNM
mgnify:FL=1